MRELIHFFLQQIFYSFSCFVLKYVWKYIDNLLSMCTMFFSIVCVIYTNLNWNKLVFFNWYYIIFFMWLNGNLSWFSNINVLNVRNVWKSHFGDDGVSSIWLFSFQKMIFSNFGMKPKLNLITFELKWMFCSDITVVLS